MRIGYTTQADLAKEIGTIWKKRKRKSFTWPYNRFKWDSSDTWWVVPASDRVAFQYAKIIVTSSNSVALPNHLFVGLYVEKGLGRSLADAGYYPSDWVLGPAWRWHGIVLDLHDGRFRAPIAEAARRLGEPLDIKLDAHVPTYRSGAIKPRHDILWYESSDGDVIIPSANPSLATQQRFLRQADSVTTLSELARALQTIPESESVWVDLYIGRSLEKSYLHDTAALDALQLTDRMLEPLAEWVV
jgi:hypothetical protein